MVNGFLATGRFVGAPRPKGALQAALIGGLAAGAACPIAKFIA